jgi:hypothetical protein
MPENDKEIAAVAAHAPNVTISPADFGAIDPAHPVHLDWNLAEAIMLTTMSGEKVSLASVTNTGTRTVVVFMRQFFCPTW